MKTVVYDVAASSSGALSVLKDYHAKALADEENEYCFLVSTPELAESENVIVKRYAWVKKSWLHRLFFGYMVAPRVVAEEGPDAVLSLQNTMMPRVRVPQTVYEHNCLPKPFCDYRFSFAKEPGLWIRQNILGAIIVRSLKSAQQIIVQTEWMKARCVENIDISPDRIDVNPPCLSSRPSGRYTRSEPFAFVYPATGVRFKNHRLILDACRILQNKGVEFKILLTLDGTESKYTKSLEQCAAKEVMPIEFIGWQSREEVFRLYESCALLFVSELESYPLPLFEAGCAGSPIVAPNVEYAIEALSRNPNALLYKQDDPVDLAKAMNQLICETSPITLEA